MAADIHTTIGSQPDCRRLAARLETRGGARPGRPVTLTFDEVERALGAPLPLAAYERRHWWLGAKKSSGRALSPAGWRIGHVDVLGHLVTFETAPP